MNRTKITLLALAALMATTVAMSACGGVCSHMDNDGNGICDLCQSSLVSEAETTPDTDPATETVPETDAAKSIITEICVKDQNGTPISGAVLQINDESNTLVETATTYPNGTVSLTLLEGKYTVIFAELPEYHLGGMPQIEIKEGIGTIDLEVINNTPDGSEEHPFFLNSETASFSFDANTTLHFSLFAGDRRSIVIENAADLTLTLDGTTHLPDENGLIKIPVVSANQQNHLSMSITSKIAQSVTVGVVAELGSSDNPIVIEALGTVTATVPKDSIVYYTYTAARSCTLVLTSEDSKNNISMTNRTTSVTTNFSNGSLGELSLDIVSGDVITIAVSVLGGDENLDSYDLSFNMEERFAD